jgi:membrane-associated phospholipid phosphatase
MAPAETSTPRPIHVRRSQEIPKVAAALALLVGTGAVAANGVPDLEERVFAWVNDLPGGLEPVLWAPMQLGSLFGPVVVAAGSWLAWRRWRPPVGALLIGVVSWQAAKVVKEGIDRGRPGDVLDEIVRRGGTPVDGLGYVSGHSAVAFALATVVSPYLRRPWRWAGYGVAGVVSLARIHVGAHFPLDTVGGAALGVTLALLYHLAVGIPDDAPVFTEPPLLGHTRPAEGNTEELEP